MQPPSYHQAIDYYFREDVSQLMWELSNQRPLKFFYYSEVDLRESRRTPLGIKLHCVESIAKFKDRIRAVARDQETRPGFIPFFGMGNVANKPGEPDKIVGWDMRFEFDLDLKSSFRVLIPIFAVLDHFGVPVLAKYSGHRSLHLMIPAEAFPLGMREKAEHKEWMDAFQALGDLFCLLSPALNRGSIRLSKEMVLTAPYSFHRYYGLLSIPLSLQEAMNFDPSSASPQNFPGVRWNPNLLVDQEDRIAPLLDLARHRTEKSADVIQLSRSVFSGLHWQNFVTAPDFFPTSDDPLTASLIVGLTRINFMPKLSNLTADQADRFANALIVMDNPEAKEGKFYRLIGKVGFHLPEETLSAVRLTLATVLARWVYGGLDEAIDHLLLLAESDEVGTPVTCAVRILSFLPASRETKALALAHRWKSSGGVPSLQTAFLALALGELSAHDATHLDIFLSDTDMASQALHQMVTQSTWLTEAQPEIAVAMLCVAFGLNILTAWRQDAEDAMGKRIIRSVFGYTDDSSQEPKKFKFAATKVLMQVE